MAGEWIKVRNDLHTHPKVVRMSSALDADRLHVIGGLHAVWCLFDVHSTDGTLSGYSAKVVDGLIGFVGFAAAMNAVNWLQIDADGLTLPEFDEHNGQSAKRRATETKRKRLERDQPTAKTTERKVSALDADKKRSREEKRREEVNTTPSNDGVAAKRPSRKCPADFLVTDEMRVWAKTECALVDVDRATAKFRDHTFKTAMTDWAGAWRNWLRKDAEFSAPKRVDAETPYQKSMRLRVAEISPELARGPPGMTANQFFERPVLQVLEMEK